jgi:hypothetical protein
VTADGDVRVPLVLRSSRRRTLGLLAIAVLCATMGVLMVTSGTPYGWLVLVFGFMGTVVFVGLLVRPNRLELSERGLTTVTLGRRWSVDWSQCGEFRATHNSLNLGAPQVVVFDCTAPGVRGHPLELGAEVLAGANAALPETYGRAATDLAALLNAYRKASG